MLIGYFPFPVCFTEKGKKEDWGWGSVKLERTWKKVEAGESTLKCIGVKRTPWHFVNLFPVTLGDSSILG